MHNIYIYDVQLDIGEENFYAFSDIDDLQEEKAYFLLLTICLNFVFKYLLIKEVSDKESDFKLTQRRCNIYKPLQIV